MTDNPQIPEQWKELMKGGGKHIFDPLKAVLENVRFRGRRLPAALPWVEPSINIPHLQACHAFVFGSPLGAIFITGALLEHTLRVAVIDTMKGIQGAMEESLWLKYKDFSVSSFLNGKRRKNDNTDPSLLARVDKIIPAQDRDWWRDVVEQIRNKVTHLDYPAMNLGVGSSEEYMGLYTLPDRERSWSFMSRSRWGFAFHRFDDSVSERFLNDATEKLRNVIANMQWKPDLHAWISQKWEYDSFFAFDWSRAGLPAK